MKSIWPRMILGSAALCSIVTSLNATRNNGDLMYLESLYFHLHVLHLPISNFVFTEAFFFFPDGLVYWPLRWITGAQEYATPMFYVLNLSATLWALNRMYRRAWPDGRAVERASALAFFLLSLTMVMRMNVTLFWPNHHGALMPTLFGLALLIERAPSAGVLILVFVTSALTVLSDGVSLMQVFAPLLVYLAWRRRWTMTATMAMGVGQGMVTLLSLKQWGILRFQTSSLLPTARTLSIEWNNLPEVLRTWGGEAWTFVAVTMLFVCTVRWVRAGRRANLAAIDHVFALSLGLTVVITLGMARLLSIYSIRYVQNYFYLSAAAVAVMSLPEYLRTDAFRRWFPRALVAYATAVGVVHAIGGFNFFDHELIRCVERATPPEARGLAEFWAAKLITFTGRRRVDQIDTDFTKYLWMNSERWYDVRPTFFVTEPGPPLAAITNHYGEPAGRVTCPGGKVVLQYPNGVPDPL